ncbi:hypothetical protein ACFLZZ_01310 [Nanoarchaeota archaeon]
MEPPYDLEPQRKEMIRSDFHEKYDGPTRIHPLNPRYVSFIRGGESVIDFLCNERMNENRSQNEKRDINEIRLDKGDEALELLMQDELGEKRTIEYGRKLLNNS